MHLLPTRLQCLPDKFAGSENSFILLVLTIMEFEGKIVHIWPEELVGKNQLPKRTFVLEEITDSPYKGGMVIDLFKEKTSLLDDLRTWDAVKAYINTRANEYNGRRYNNISARKIEKLSPSTDSTPTAQPAETASTQDYEDELPF